MRKIDAFLETESIVVINEGAFSESSCRAGLPGQTFMRTVSIKFSFPRDTRQPLSNKALVSAPKLCRPKKHFSIFVSSAVFQQKIR